MTIWNILDQAFPGALGNPISKEGILAFLDRRRIAISDTVLECFRKSPTALDKDLIPTKLNHELVQQIATSNIREILFTSGFGTNNAFKLFYVDILKQRITRTIRQDKEVVLESKFFSRPVKLSILPSPSGTANISLSVSSAYQVCKDKYKHSNRPVHDFKVDCYRERFLSDEE